MEELFNKLAESLVFSTQAVEGSKVYFANKELYEAIELNNNNFHQINADIEKNIDQNKNKKIAFIDGGNAEILSTSSFTLHFLRIYCVVFQNNKKTSDIKFEGFVFVNDVPKENKISHSIRFFPVTKNSFYEYFKEMFSKIKFEADGLGMNIAKESQEDYNGINRLIIIPSLIRRFMELSLAAFATRSLDKDDLIVLDGTLQAFHSGEDKFMNELFNQASQKEIIVSALSKTSRLLTEQGKPLFSSLDKMTELNNWYYNPIVKIRNPKHNSELFALKLHDKAKYAFRFELYNAVKDKIEQVTSLLALNSSDPVFLGYPYGLVVADKFARVSNQEVDYFRTLIKSKSGKNWQDIESDLTSLNAHNILDNIEF
ncbi:DNA double-strand break repair nuclease NurA [Nanoarchaeota archaeon]